MRWGKDQEERAAVAQKSHDAYAAARQALAKAESAEARVAELEADVAALSAMVRRLSAIAEPPAPLPVRKLRKVA